MILKFDEDLHSFIHSFIHSFRSFFMIDEEDIERKDEITPNQGDVISHIFALSKQTNNIRISEAWKHFEEHFVLFNYALEITQRPHKNEKQSKIHECV